MFIPLWCIVPVILLLILIALFMASIWWLARTLEGYPMFVIQNGDRDTGVVPLPLRIRAEPDRSPVLSAFSETPGVGVTNKRAVAIGRHAGRW